MASEEFSIERFLAPIRSCVPVSWDRVCSRLGAEDLSLAEAATLLTPQAHHYLEGIAQAAHDLTLRRFGRTIKLYAPLYLSNECINGCAYCGFNARSDIPRRTLTCEEALAEGTAVIAAKHQHLLLVAGEHPSKVTLDFLETIAHAVRPHVASLAVEVQPFDRDGYARLAHAGIDGVTLYQETYDAATYEQMHTFGPKRDFASRLTAIDAAGEAGMRFLGIGALLGLAPWRHEILAVIAHARALMKKHWRSTVTVSLPRIRDCASTFAPPHPVSDAELTQIICALRLALPDAGIVLSTREPATLRDHLLPLGVTQMSAGSVTQPGGYTLREQGGEQFHLEDHRSASEIATMLERAGYDPLWKDWDTHLHGTVTTDNLLAARYPERMSS